MIHRDVLVRTVLIDICKKQQDFDIKAQVGDLAFELQRCVCLL